jgi:hypothetical protein
MLFLFLTLEEYRISAELEHVMSDPTVAVRVSCIRAESCVPARVYSLMNKRYRLPINCMCLTQLYAESMQCPRVAELAKWADSFRVSLVTPSLFHPSFTHEHFSVH